MSARPEKISGVFVPAITPFKKDMSVDQVRLTRLCRWLLDEGADGLAVFGTTSEGNSLSAAERCSIMDDLVAGGVPARALLPGTGACALPDAVALTRHAVELGAAGVLVLPAFYYKNTSDDGIFAYYAQLIEGVGDERLRVYLYHFPVMSTVNMSPGLIGRLLKAYPGTIAGLKDSSGDFAATKRLIAEFPGLAVFPSSEANLDEGLSLGAAGCISASANIQPGAIRQLIDAHGTPGAAALNEKVCALRHEVEKFPFIGALKAAFAHYLNDDAWLASRPPLVELARDEADKLLTRLMSLEEAGGFTRGLERLRGS